jgi:general secretion pathway protein A
LKLRYTIENRRGGAVLAGPSGSGKTLLLAVLRAALSPEHTPIVRVAFPQMPAEHLVAYLAGRLSGEAAPAPEATAVHRSIEQIERSLAAGAERGQHAVVVIEEAHLLDDRRVLEALRMLLNCGPEGRPGLTLLLVGQPGILPILDRMPQLQDRLAVRSLLRPLNELETGEYVAHRLRTAGAVRPLFQSDALSTLYRLAHGIPRQINRLADLSLLVGYAEKGHAITAEQVEAVHGELAAAA